MEMGLGELCLNYCILNLIIPVNSVLSLLQYLYAITGTLCIESLCPPGAAPVVRFRAAPGKPSIAHRDVKSRNVLLEWEREPSASAPLLRAKLADFGLALAFDRPAAVLARSQPQVRALFHSCEIL